jgi:hypothetical protein
MVRTSFFQHPRSDLEVFSQSPRKGVCALGHCNLKLSVKSSDMSVTPLLDEEKECLYGLIGVLQAALNVLDVGQVAQGWDTNTSRT